MAKKGEKLSQETKDKIRMNHARFWEGKIKPLTPETIAKIRLAHIGRVATDEARKNLSTAHLGQKSWNKGMKLPDISGERHWNWQGGISEENSRIRNSLENKLWRKAVFERECHERGGKLEADHIKPFFLFPELRFAIDNGRTLCKPCHKRIGWNFFIENNPRKNHANL